MFDLCNLRRYHPKTLEAPDYNQPSPNTIYYRFRNKPCPSDLRSHTIQDSRCPDWAFLAPLSASDLWDAY